MLELLTDHTWQIQVLMVEAIVSAVIGTALAYRGFQRTLATMTIFLLWNAALLALLITGGNASWQHFTVGAWYLLDTFVVVFAGVTRKKTGPESGFGPAFFITLVVIGLLALLITG